MSVFTITGRDKEDFKEFFSQDSFECIGQKGYYTIGATEDEDFVAGVLQFFIDEDYIEGFTAKITYLFVGEEFRGQGIGTILVNEFKDVVSNSNIDIMTVEVFENASEELRKIFEDNGFNPVGERAYYCMPLLNLCKKPAIKTAAIGACRSVEELTGPEITSFFNGISPAILQNGLKDYDLKTSSFSDTDDGKCLLLIKEEEEDVLETAFMYASEGCENMLVSLLSFSANRAKELYGPACKLQIACSKPMEYDLVSKLGTELTADKYTIYKSERKDTSSDIGTDTSEQV